MGIGSVTSMNRGTGIQTAMARPTDSKTKSIQNEITGVQQKMRAISSKEELSATEKMDERKKLQKEIAGLNTELKQHQEKFRKSQKREIRMAELQEGRQPAKEGQPEAKIQAAETSPDRTEEKNRPSGSPQTGRPGNVIAKSGEDIVILKEGSGPDEKRGISAGKKPAGDQEETAANEKAIAEERTSPIAGKETESKNGGTDAGLSRQEVHAIASADNSLRQAERQGTVITRIRDGIAILKGEIKQEELQGSDPEKKQEELEKMEKKEERATAFQFSVLGEANNAGKPAETAGMRNGAQSTQVNSKANAFARAFPPVNEESQALQQNFNVSFAN